ncbi:MAG: YgiT-type zinc finger protein [Chloroflexota bacterium]|nr:YgiT-type zinc finger protein [Chloroflexota bacterium]
MTTQDCRYCRGELEEQLVSRIQRVGERWFVIENVPALVCKQCGETYFTPDAHDLVVRLIAGNQPPMRVESVAVYDAAKVG